MSFRFLHTADWQLGKPFANFEPELRGRLRDQRLQVIGRLADAARAGGARHILVAGDVWDQETPADAVLRKPVDQMAQAHDIIWWLMPGNHDPGGEETLWSRLRDQGLPENIRLLTETRAHAIEPGVFVLPAPLSSNRPGFDPTEPWEQMPTPEGAIRIGLGHGGVVGFGSQAEEAVTINPARLKSAGLAYMALGDWHGTKRIAPNIWYSGTPEPDRFRNNDQGQALFVEIGAEPDIVKTGHFTWMQVERSCDPDTDLALLIMELFPAGVLDHMLLRLDLTGALGLAARSQLDEMLDGERSRLAYFELRDEGLQTTADAGDLEDLLGDGVLAGVAERLAEMTKTPQGDDAALALRLLHRYAQG